MPYHAYQQANKIDTFYVSIAAENYFVPFDPIVEESGEMDIPDGVFFASSLFSVLKERLERFQETVVLLESPIPFGQIDPGKFACGVIITPKTYRSLLQEWETFRLADGDNKYPSKTPAFLHDFMSYASQRPLAFMQITRPEYERFCERNQVVPSYIKTDTGYVALVRTPTVMLVGKMDTERKVQPGSFLKVTVDGKFRINRDAEPTYFEPVNAEIETMEFIVRNDFSVRVNFYNLYGDAVVEVFDSKQFGIPKTPLEIVAEIRKRAEPEIAEPEIEIAPPVSAGKILPVSGIPTSASPVESSDW